MPSKPRSPPRLPGLESWGVHEGDSLPSEPDVLSSRRLHLSSRQTWLPAHFAWSWAIGLFFDPQENEHFPWSPHRSPSSPTWAFNRLVLEVPLRTGGCKDAVQFSSGAQSCPTLCDPMGYSMPGLPVHHQLPELTQTHVHWVSDAIQTSHPLLSPSPPTFNLSQHQGLFKWVSSSHHLAKVLEFQLQHQSFQWTPRIDL